MSLRGQEPALPMLTIVSTSPLACGIVLTTWAPQERSLTLNKPRPWVCFPASLGITPGCSLTRLRDQGQRDQPAGGGQGTVIQPASGTFSAESCLRKIRSLRWEQQWRVSEYLGKSSSGQTCSGVGPIAESQLEPALKVNHGCSCRSIQEACGSCSSCW